MTVSFTNLDQPKQLPDELFHADCFGKRLYRYRPFCSTVTRPLRLLAYALLIGLLFSGCGPQIIKVDVPSPEFTIKQYCMNVELIFEDHLATFTEKTQTTSIPGNDASYEFEVGKALSQHIYEGMARMFSGVQISGAANGGPNPLQGPISLYFVFQHVSSPVELSFTPRRFLWDVTAKGEYGLELKMMVKDFGDNLLDTTQKNARGKIIQTTYSSDGSIFMPAFSQAIDRVSYRLVEHVKNSLILQDYVKTHGHCD